MQTESLKRLLKALQYGIKKGLDFFCFIGPADEWFKSDPYLVRTIATASLSILSPNTNMLSSGSAFNAWKIASVATGSTADINDPNAKLKKRGAN